MVNQIAISDALSCLSFMLLIFGMNLARINFLRCGAQFALQSHIKSQHAAPGPGHRTGCWSNSKDFAAQNDGIPILIGLHVYCHDDCETSP